MQLARTDCDLGSDPGGQGKQSSGITGAIGSGDLWLRFTSRNLENDTRIYLQVSSETAMLESCSSQPFSANSIHGFSCTDCGTIKWGGRVYDRTYVLEFVSRWVVES